MPRSAQARVNAVDTLAARATNTWAPARPARRGSTIAHASGQQRHRLIVAGLVLRVLAVANDDGPRCAIDVVDLQPTDLVLAHPAGQGEAAKRLHVGALPRLAAPVRIQLLELDVGRLAIAFVGRACSAPDA
jgi:hypothetical protein